MYLCISSKMGISPPETDDPIRATLAFCMYQETYGFQISLEAAKLGGFIGKLTIKEGRTTVCLCLLAM